ncbi:unnamed protein product, partial [Cylicocyclus nassatus]
QYFTPSIASWEIELVKQPITSIFILPASGRLVFGSDLFQRSRTEEKEYPVEETMATGDPCTEVKDRSASPDRTLKLWTCSWQKEVMDLRQWSDILKFRRAILLIVFV